MAVHGPQRSNDPAVVRRLVDRDGVAILTGVGTTPASVAEAGRRIFALDVRSMSEPTVVGTGRSGAVSADGESARLPPRTDGFEFGDLYPDYFVLGSGPSSDEVAESFVVDGHAVLADVAKRIGGGDLVSRMSTVVIDQTAPGEPGSPTPLVERTSEGRLMLRRFPFQSPAPGSTDAGRDQAMIDTWHDAVRLAGERASRFAVRRGEVVVFDNYRMMHGLDTSADTDQAMWQVRVWTTSACGVPEDEPLAGSGFESTSP